VAEDAGAQSIANVATSISAGPEDESSQTVSFTVTNTNNALFGVQPTMDASGISLIGCQRLPTIQLLLWPLAQPPNPPPLRLVLQNFGGDRRLRIALLLDLVAGQGEKLHEQMISPDDAPHTYSYGDYFKILPAIHNWSSDAGRIGDGVPVGEGFDYSSDNNPEWMSVKELQQWIAANKAKIGSF
jgi:hypothetical protein